MRTYAPLAFNCTPEEEAKRLNIDLIELFRRMWKKWHVLKNEGVGERQKKEEKKSTNPGG